MAVDRVHCSNVCDFPAGHGAVEGVRAVELRRERWWGTFLKWSGRAGSQRNACAEEQEEDGGEIVFHGFFCLYCGSDEENDFNLVAFGRN